MNASRKIVIFGAGAAGKGLIGLLFSQAGFRVTFVDINDALVTRLHDAGRYRVLVHGLEGGQEELAVEDFEILHAGERASIAERIAGADLVMTAVFAHNLPDVARTIALGVQACRGVNRTRPLNVVACENMKKSSSILAGHVEELLGEEERAFRTEVFGFPDCMINRVVPDAEDPLMLETEDYCEWTVDAGGIRGAWPDGTEFIERVENQQARLDRKLFVYNGGHAATAYFGHRRGHAWIHEAVADDAVVKQVNATLNELAVVVQHHHGFSEDAMQAYTRDFWLRCRNPGLKDEIARIGRQPERKLGRNERFVAPAKLAGEYGLPRAHIVKAMVAGLGFNHPADEQALTLTREIETNGLVRTLERIMDLDGDDALVKEIEQEYSR